MEMAPLPPGYRFQPTDVELILYYLKRRILGRVKSCAAMPLQKSTSTNSPPGIFQGNLQCLLGIFSGISFVVAAASTLPGQELTGQTKLGTGKLLERTGRWTVGMKRTLVFHAGKGRKEERTDWVMHEYRLVESETTNAGIRLDDFVLCKVYQKSGPGPKIGEQYGAPLEEEEEKEELNDANWDAYCLSNSSAPGPSHGVMAGGRVSLSLLSANNGKSSSSGIRPDRASHLDVNWDMIHIRQLADILGCLSTNPVGQDGPSSDSTAYHHTEALFDDNEAIFDITDQVVPSSLVSLCKQCDSCGLNDLLLCHAGHVPDGSNHEGPPLDKTTVSAAVSGSGSGAPSS
ncbi:hypothetical protein VPH35_107646 [Triticum aestivum]